MMRYFFFIFYFSYLAGQSQTMFPPLKGKLTLAGNFCELRKNHFHMGLDFRTDNKENLPVYASEDGFLSRVLISSNGYGKALYLSHPKIGLMSVYAHLNSFAPEIQSWVERTQYALQKNTIDTSISRNLFPIVKGQLIGYSGNTGGSSAPHLHYEVRDLKTEHTINPMKYFKIEDTKKPIINNILLYKLENGASIYDQNFDIKSIQNKSINLSYPNLGIAVSVTDYMNNTDNIFGIYSMKIFVNGALNYMLKFDKMDFNWQSHIRAMSDYDIPIRDIYKGFYENCSINPTDQSSSNGIIKLEENILNKIKIEVSDFNGNLNSTQFKVLVHSVLNESEQKREKCKNEIVYSDKNFDIIIPKNGVAENVVSLYGIDGNLGESELQKILLFSEGTACLKPYQFRYFGTSHVPELQDKIYLESTIDGYHKSYIGSWIDGKMVFPKVKNFGKMTIKYDLTSPSISKPIKTTKGYAIPITDKESEIASYSLYIDGEWRICYYDEKNNLLNFSPLSIDKNKKVMILVKVEDKVGNKNMEVFEIIL